MTDDNEEGKLSLPKSLNLNTVVLIVSIGASFWAQWAIFKDRADNQKAQIDEIYNRLNQIDTRYYAFQNEFTKARSQLDDVLENARRRSQLDRSLTPTVIPR